MHVHVHAVATCNLQLAPEACSADVTVARHQSDPVCPVDQWVRYLRTVDVISRLLVLPRSIGLNGLDCHLADGSCCKL